jgi:glutaredoxin
MRYNEYNEHSGNPLSQTDKIIVYTSNGCPKCTLLKEWLKNKNTEFEEKNIEDINVMTELVMRNLVVMSAPALEVEEAFYTEDQIFNGDSLADTKILEILEQK